MKYTQMKRIILKSLPYLLFHLISIFCQANGLTMKLFPIHSPHLQILPKSFTTHDRQQFLVNISLSRALQVQNKHPKLAPDSIKSAISYLDDNFLITNITIVNKSLRYTAYVIVDTLRDLTWIQCFRCNPCFLQRNPFPAERWSSFTRMSLDDLRCAPHIYYNGSCGFEDSYGNGHTEGYLGKATFMFQADGPGDVDINQYYPNIGFGCGIRNHNFLFNIFGGENEIAGVLGLSPGPRSFINQLDMVIKERFSYCLVPFLPISGSASATTLSFGDDAKIGGDDERKVQTFEFKPDAHHFAYLGAILVNGVRLHIDPIIFKLDELEYQTGFFIGLTSPLTLLARPAYSAVRRAMVDHFKKYGWLPMERTLVYDLCYTQVMSGNQVYPTMAFNFLKSPNDKGEIQFIIPPENLFANMGVMGTGFCLQMLPTDGLSVLGAFQQVNHKFLFDLKNKLVSFIPQKC
ncbi:hypothetical protein RND81_09G219400 [Saponaria officinalis]|uniref:Peptidase A1 domain-containing protein n=1 Tax=Saponaria officinalis TaxID=3572 RepID=A0AAW1IPY7_SAPOF